MNYFILKLKLNKKIGLFLKSLFYKNFKKLKRNFIVKMKKKKIQKFTDN